MSMTHRLGSVVVHEFVIKLSDMCPRKNKLLTMFKRRCPPSCSNQQCSRGTACRCDGACGMTCVSPGKHTLKTASPTSCKGSSIWFETDKSFFLLEN